MKRFVKKSNVSLIILISLFFVTCIGTTYAWLELNADDSSSSGLGGCFNVSYTGSQNITSLTSALSYTDEGVGVVTVKLKKDNSCKIYTTADIHINTTSTTAPISTVQAFKYRIASTATTINGNSNYAEGVINRTGDIVLANVDLTNSEVTYTIYLWVDANISSGYYSGKTYTGYVYASSTQSSTMVG